MVKMGNPLINEDELLWINEFMNSSSNSLIVKSSIINSLIANYEPRLGT